MAPNNNWNSHLNRRVRREVSRQNILEQDRKDNEDYFYHHRVWNSDLNRRVRRDFAFRSNLEAEEKRKTNEDDFYHNRVWNSDLNRRVRRDIEFRRNLEAEEKIVRNNIIIEDEEVRQNDSHLHVISDEEYHAHLFRKAKRQIAVDEKILRKKNRKRQLRMGSQNEEAFFRDTTEITKNLALDFENAIN